MPPLVLPDGLLERLALPRQLGLPLLRRVGDEIVDRMAHSAYAGLVRIDEGKRRRVDRGVEGSRIDKEVSGGMDSIVGSAARHRDIVGRLLLGMSVEGRA